MAHCIGWGPCDAFEPCNKWFPKVVGDVIFDAFFCAPEVCNDALELFGTKFVRKLDA